MIIWISLRLAELSRFFAALEKILLCLLLLTIIVLGFGQIVARNLFSTGFIWMDPVLKVAVLWIVFTGASLASEYKGHIKIDILYHIIRSETSKRRIKRAADLFTVVICTLLLVAAVQYMGMMSSDSRATIIPGIPDWQFRWIIPYAFWMMGIRSLIPLLDSKNPTDRLIHRG